MGKGVDGIRVGAHHAATFSAPEISMRQQRGVSFFGFVGFLLVAGFLAFLAMRLFPVYSEYHNVVSSMKGLAADPAAAGKSSGEIKKMLMRRLEISYVESVKPEHVEVKRSGNETEMRVAYEVRRPLAYNLEFVATFEKTLPLRRGESVD